MKNPRYCEGSFKEQKQKRSGCRCCQWSAGMHQHMIQLALFNSIPEHPNTTMIDSCRDPRVKETTIKRAPTQKKIRYWCLDHYFWEFSGSETSHLQIPRLPTASSIINSTQERHEQRFAGVTAIVLQQLLWHYLQYLPHITSCYWLYISLLYLDIPGPLV